MTYTVKELSEKTGLTEHTIRYYTDQNLLPCERDKNNRRIFNEESINWLTGIRCLRACGVSIEDVKTYCSLCLEGDSTLMARYEFMLQQQKLALEKLAEAKQIAHYMEHKVAHYEEILKHEIPDDMNPATKKITEEC